jgi:hypothetical protein
MSALRHAMAATCNGCACAAAPLAHRDAPAPPRAKTTGSACCSRIHVLQPCPRKMADEPLARGRSGKRRKPRVDGSHFMIDAAAAAAAT